MSAESAPPRRRLTARGAVTRDRIVRAAADLMHAGGVSGTTIDQVIEASGTSKSQLYHYFADKEALVAAVIKLQASRVMERQEPYLEQLSTIADLRKWRDVVVNIVAGRHGAHGCEIGSLVSEMADQSEPARILLAATLRTWESYLSAGLTRMQEHGELPARLSSDELAIGIMAAYQGGYLLSQASHSARPLALALDHAIDHLVSLRADPQPAADDAAS